MRRLGSAFAWFALGVFLFTPKVAVANGDHFLPPDQAFRLSANGQPAAVTLDWKIADGYYLYRSRFKILADTGAIGAVKFSPGETKDDPNFGRVVVYHHQAALTVPVKQIPADRELRLTVTYQGCAEAGLCYAPITQEINVAIPAADAGAGIAAGEGTPGPGVAAVSGQDQLARLIEQTNPFWFVLVFFGLGVLLAFTPCVLPMVPILAGIIGAESGRLSARRGFTLSLAYVLAMALVYTAIGVAAGFAGAGLQAYFQAPWVIALFVALFVALALSLFGLYELRLPGALVNRMSRLSGRRRGGTWAGAAAMGALSALIVSPCIAAPLAGALIVIGRAGEPVRGGIALAALALGMGAPLLVFGTVAGRLLPRAGIWMTTLERLFGVVMLAFAVWLLGRIVPAPVTLLLWGVTGVIASVFLGAFVRLGAAAGTGRQLVRALGFVVFAWAVLLIVGGAVGSTNPLGPLAGLQASPGAPKTAALDYRPIRTPQDLNAQLERAAAADRPVMVDFYADWCTSCLEMEHTTFHDPAVRTALGRMWLLRADVTANSIAERALLKRFGLYGPPAYLFFNGNGRLLAADTVVGTLDAEAFLTHVRQALTSD
ncbi:MAG: protein-disulfide reductase DsbD [Gammaproteobacteria bacterium]